MASAATDLSITGTVNTVPSNVVFAKEANPIKITSISNSGPDPLTNIKVALYASDVSGGTVPINTTTIASLASGGTATVTLIDPTIRSLEGGTVTYTAVVDPDNSIPETSEVNNNKSSTAVPVKYNGYKGKRYWEGGSDITTKHTYDIQGNILYSTQPESAYSGVGWTGRTETWSASDLPIPTGSTIEKAFLYVSYNWDTSPGGVPDWSAMFNGNQLTGGTLYTDKSNFGMYADYKYGLYSFDVTGQFNSAGNSLVITPNSGNSNAVYPSTLVVIYKNPAETRKQIFINEECDELGYSDSSYGTSPNEATAYAPFTGMSVDVSKVKNATLYSFAGSAGPNEGNLLFNGNTVANNAWEGTASTSSAQVFNVTDYISASGNEAGIQEGTTSGTMLPIQQILVMEYQQEVAPVANFTAAPTSGNSPLTVQFTDASTGTVSSYAWDFNNDGKVDSTDKNPSYTYNSAGTYTVNLTVTGPGGTDSEAKTGYIVVNSAATSPVADFTTADATNGLAPLPVTFTDQSTNSPTSWKWEYNNGSGWVQFSTDKNPTYSFANAGTYDIRLTATNSGGSDDEAKSHYIAVASGREPLVTVQSGTVSGDLYVNSTTTWPSTEVTRSFTLPAAAVGNIQWAKLYVNTYSGSAQNTYALTSTVKLDGNGDGTYETTLGNETMDIASETNENSYPLNDHVNKVYSDYEAQYDVTSLITAANPAVNVKSQAISGKNFDGRIKGVTLVVAYNDPSSTNQTYYWVNHGSDWSNPGDGQTTFNTAGLNSGWNSAESKIREISTSDASYNFNGVSKTGKGSTPNYDGLNTWDVTNNITAGQASSLAYSKPSGSYKTTLATLKVKYGASVPAPVANFTAAPTSGNAPLSVQFTDASTGNVNSYAWDFNNDGIVDNTSQNPSYTYNTTGTYTVNLTVKGPGGTDSEVKTGYIVVSSLAAPVANFTATPLVGTAPLSVTFTDQSTNSPTSWKWEYNNGSGWVQFSTDKNPTFSFATASPYDIRLTATNSGGSDEETKLHYIAVASGREPLKTVQTGIVSGDLYISSPTTYATGVTEVTKTFILPAAAVGNIQWAKLYVNTYSGSAQNTYALTSTVKLDGNGDGTFETTLGNETMDIASESNGNSYPLNDHVNKVYSDYEAQYDVSSLITSTNPAVNVKSEAISGKTFDGRIKGLTLVVAYNNSSSTNQTYYWVNHGGDWSSPGDGQTTFNTAELSSGWTSAESKIRQLSTSDANYTFNGIPKTGSGSTPNLDGLNTWDVTNAITAGQSSTLSYSKTSGSYKTTLATLKVKYITSVPAPVANFTAAPTSGISPLTVQFTDASTGNVNSYAWDFNNDGIVDNTSKNPSYIYSVPGTYTVNLTVTGPDGSNSKVRSGYIVVSEPLPAAPVANFTAAPTSGNTPLTVQFSDASTGAISSYSWDFDNDGTVDSTEQNPSHTYSIAGKYTVNLTVTGAGGNDSEVKTEYIVVNEPLPGAPVANFTVNETFGILPLTVKFDANASQNAVSYSWDFDDGSTGTGQIIEHTFNNAGTYNVVLNVTNSNGISSSDAKVITVTPAQAAALSIAKTANVTSYSAADQVIKYTYNVTNTGNSAIAAPINVTDNKTGTIVIQNTGTLAVGAMISGTANYVVQQSDVDYGSITNNAFATAGSIESNTVDVTVAKASAQGPALTITKIANPTTYSAAGQKITYTYVVTNSGTVPIKSISVTDNKINVKISSATLAPGSSVIGKGTYTIRKADINAGSVTNTAYATGRYNGKIVASKTVTTTVTSTFVPSPALTITKTPHQKTYNRVGREITYTYIVKNTGNVPISDIGVTDNKTKVYLERRGTLTPGKSFEGGSNYITKQADVTAGSITNSAYATGTYNGQAVTSNTVTATVTYKKSWP